MFGDFQTEQCDDGNNVDGDGCSATCQLEEAPNAQCSVDVLPDSVYVYNDGSIDPSPLQINYQVSAPSSAHVETNIPGVQINSSSNTMIYNNPSANYYIRVYDSNNVLLTQCNDNLDLNSCGDDVLQPEYEQCELDTRIMPADRIVNDIQALLPNLQKIGWNRVYAKSFSQSIKNIFSAKKTAKVFKVSASDNRDTIDGGDTFVPDDYGIKDPIPSDTDGCSTSCQLEEPTCRVIVNPNPIIAGQRAYFS
ncbi:MAG: hypothetical protein GXP45_03645 [bacterium]|nr:hypothetical protein [bacterium]